MPKISPSTGFSGVNDAPGAASVMESTHGCDNRHCGDRGACMPWYRRLFVIWQETMQMEDQEIYDRLRDIFSDVFDEESIAVTPGLSADDIDGWDSLTHIRLMLTIEKAFKVKFSTSEVGKLANVGELVALIRAKT
jgi:acyl carrier protein